MAIREVIFRGKRADNGEWVEGDLLQIKYYNKPIIECKIMPQTPVSSAYPVLPETVGQYTGLTDKNGKRIFEGDICKFKHLGDANVGQIVFNYSTATFVMCFSIIVGAYGEKAVRRMLLSVFDDIKIIGNIHDNPELLGKEDT